MLPVSSIGREFNLGLESVCRKSKIFLKKVKKHVPWKPSARVGDAGTIAAKVTLLAPHQDAATGPADAAITPAATEAMAPAVHISFEPNGSPVIALARKSPPIRNLVFEGGGAKGVVYPSFLKEMERKQPGFVAGLDQVAGTSAGATMAFLLAAGVSLDEMEKFAVELNLLKQMGGSSKGVTSSVHLKRNGLLSGLKLRKTLHAISIKPAAVYYKDHIANDPAQIKAIQAQYGGESFLKRAQDGFSSGLTFNDLSILHTLNPEQFKPLHITAYDVKRKQTFYFDGKNPKTRNVRCFEAVGASMAIPVVFRSVKLQLEGESSARTFVDGGVGSNAPLEIFKGNPAETMLLVFESDGLARQILHDPAIAVSACRTQSLKQIAAKTFRAFQMQIPFMRHQKTQGDLNSEARAPKWYGSPPSLLRVWLLGKRYAENVRKDHQKIYDLALNAVVVPHGDIDTLSFAASSERKQDCIKTAKKAAAWYMDAVRPADGIVQKEYASLEEACASLTPQEIRQLNEVAGERLRESEAHLRQLEEAGGSQATLARQAARCQLEMQFYSAIKERNG